MAYAILRCKKIKTMQQVCMIARHNHRLKSVPNADPARMILNRKIVGSGDIVADVKEAMPEKIRKNAVIAIEMVLTASPEYFRPTDPTKYGEWETEKLLDFRRHAEAFMRQRFGKNLVSMDLHLDEATPHYHCLVIPKRPDGKLDANSLFNPNTLRDLQDIWGKWMERIGLKRGEKNSKAKHTKVKQAYEILNRITPNRLAELLDLLEKQDTQIGGKPPEVFPTVPTPKPAALP